MASISLNVNEHRKLAHSYADGECVNFQSHLYRGWDDEDLYHSDNLYLHGSRAELRRFAQQILDLTDSKLAMAQSIAEYDEGSDD